MNGILIRWLTLTVAIIFTSYLFEGIHVSGFTAAFFAAAMLGILNALFRPILLLLTLPLNVLSLGFFTFVINALLLKTASSVITGFDVDGFWYAVFGSLAISVVSWLLNVFINESGGVTYYRVDRKGPFRDRHQDRQKRSDGDIIDLEHKGDNRWE